MFLLGWGEERLGNGVGGCCLRRKNWGGNFVLFYYQLFCRLIRMTCGFGNIMPLQNTMLVMFTTF